MEFAGRVFFSVAVSAALALPTAEIFETTEFTAPDAAQDAAKVDPSRREYFTPGLILETGARNAACDVLRFTRDGKYLLAAGDDKVVRNWRVTPQGLAASELPILRWRIFREYRGNIYAMDLSPDQNTVVVGGNGTQGLFAATVLDRTSGKILQATSGRTTDGNDDPKTNARGTIWSATFSPSGKRVGLGTDQGTVWLWEPATNGLRIIGDHQIKPADIAASLGKVYFTAFADENTVVSVAGDGRMIRWDLTGAAALRVVFAFAGRITTPPVLSPDRRWLATCVDRANFVEIVSFPNGQADAPVPFPADQFPHRLAFNSDASVLAVAIRHVNQATTFFQEGGGHIALYDRKKNSLSRGPEQGMYAEAIAYSPVDDKLLAVAGGNDHEVVLWNLPTGKRIGDDIRSPGSCLWSVALSPNDRYVAFQDHRNPAAPSPNQRGTGAWRYFDLEKRVFVDAKKAAFVPAPPLETAGGWRVLTSTPQVREAETWFVQKNGGVPQKLPWSRLQDDFPRCYAFLPERPGRPTRLLVGHYWGVSMFELTDAGPRRVRLFKGHEGYVTSLAVSKNGTKLITASRDQTLAGWDLEDWETHPSLGADIFPRNDAAGKPALMVGKVELGSPLWETGLSEKDQIVLVVTGGKNIAYNVSGDHGNNKGTIADALEALRAPLPAEELYLGWRRPGEDTHFEQLTNILDRPLWRFFPTRNKEWVLWRWRDYYYDTSTSGDFQIGWQRSFDIKKTPTFYRAEQFRKKFLKPALVTETLDTWKSKQGLVRFQQIEPPKVEMTASTDRIADKDAKDVDVVVRVLPDGSQDNQVPVRVIVWINDYEFKVWPLADLAREKDAYVVRARLPHQMFRRGQNLVMAQCYNKAELRAEATPIVIQCQRAPAPPKMYGLVVGVGNYTASRKLNQDATLINLSSRGDADVVVRALNSQNGKLYADVQIIPLNDKQATATAILGALDKLAKKVGPDDLLVFHLGGHGVQKSQLLKITTPQQRAGLGAFLFCLGDFDLTKLQNTTLGFEQLSAKFVKMPCHKILLIDACHSGLASKVLDSDNNPIRVLTRDGVGPVILTSCDSTQEAQEDSSGTVDSGGATGFFTIAIRRILEDDDYFAEADRNRDGTVDALELAQGIRAQVAGLVKQLREERAAKVDSQSPVDFVPRLLERLPVAKMTADRDRRGDR